MTHFGGKTADAGAPILSAKYWTKGKQILGTVLRTFSTENGECYVIQLNKPIEVDRENTYPPVPGKEKLEKVSVGALKGFGMALQAAGLPGAKLLVGDKVQISCTGTTPSGKGNDQIDFDVQVDRDEAKAAAAPF